MTEIKTGSTHVGLPDWVQEILTGAIIVIAVPSIAFGSGREATNGVTE